MGLLDDCSDEFGSTDLYTVLGVNKGCTAADIKKGYHKVALKVHPDRATERNKDAANRKFQILGKAYSILSDQDKKALYDECGEVEEENDTLPERDWEAYWRIIFSPITQQDIKQFEQQYKDSEEELRDLFALYDKNKGDFDCILEEHMCATVDDEERLKTHIRQGIKSKKIKPYKAFTSETKAKSNDRKKRAQEEALEAEEMQAELGLGDGEDALMSLIAARGQQRQKEADSFLAGLEAKYSQPKNGASKKKKSK